MEHSRPLPAPDADTAPFWEGCRARELRVQQCSRCGLFRFPPRGLCPRCLSWDAAWQRLEGGGTVSSFVAVHRATHPAFSAQVPYVIAQVLMDGTEGQVAIPGNIVGCPWDAVRVGMPVTATFLPVEDDVVLPQFTPVHASAQHSEE